MLFFSIVIYNNCNIIHFKHSQNTLLIYLRYNILMSNLFLSLKYKVQLNTALNMLIINSLLLFFLFYCPYLIHSYLNA